MKRIFTLTLSVLLLLSLLSSCQTPTPTTGSLGDPTAPLTAEKTREETLPATTGGAPATEEPPVTKTEEAPFQEPEGSGYQRFLKAAQGIWIVKDSIADGKGEECWFGYLAVDGTEFVNGQYPEYQRTAPITGYRLLAEYPPNELYMGYRPLTEGSSYELKVKYTEGFEGYNDEGYLEVLRGFELLPNGTAMVRFVNSSGEIREDFCIYGGKTLEEAQKAACWYAEYADVPFFVPKGEAYERFCERSEGLWLEEAALLRGYDAETLYYWYSLSFPLKSIVGFEEVEENVFRLEHYYAPRFSEGNYIEESRGIRLYTFLEDGRLCVEHYNPDGSLADGKRFYLYGGKTREELPKTVREFWESQGGTHEGAEGKEFLQQIAPMEGYWIEERSLRLDREEIPWYRYLRVEGNKLSFTCSLEEEETKTAYSYGGSGKTSVVLYYGPSRPRITLTLLEEGRLKAVIDGEEHRFVFAGKNKSTMMETALQLLKG